MAKGINFASKYMWDMLLVFSNGMFLADTPHQLHRLAHVPQRQPNHSTVICRSHSTFQRGRFQYAFHKRKTENLLQINHEKSEHDDRLLAHSWNFPVLLKLPSDDIHKNHHRCRSAFQDTDKRIYGYRRRMAWWSWLLQANS